MEEQTVRIECEGAAKLPVSELVPFQGALKSLSKANYKKLRKEILQLGFSEPISVWKNDGEYKVLNGHQRLATLVEMQSEGFIVPEIPVNFVNAKSFKEARLKVLSLTSQYGEIEHDGLYQFMVESEISPEEMLESFRFPEINMKEFVNDYFTDGNPDENKKGQVDIVKCPECGHVFEK